MDEKYLNEEIVFLESELLDDDPDAPLGVLLHTYEPQKTDEPPIAEESAKQREPEGGIAAAAGQIGTDTTAETENNPSPVEETDEDIQAEEEMQPEISENDEDAEPQALAYVTEETDSDAEKAETEETVVNPPIEETIEANTVDEPLSPSPIAAKSGEEVSSVLSESRFEVAADKAPKKKTAKKISEDEAKAAEASAWAVADIKPKKTRAEKTKTTDAPVTAEDNEQPSPKQTKEKQTAVKPAAKKQIKNAEDNKVAKEEKKATKPAAAVKETPVKKAASKAEAPAENVLVAGDDSAPHGKFVIKKTDKGNFVYKLYSFNHRVVAIGAEQYSSLATCKGGINSVINNAEKAPIEDQTLKKWEEQKCPKWQVYADKKGEIRLRLLASNGNIVATTNDGYLSKDAAKKGIEAIGRASKGASIVRNDNLW